MTQRVDSESAGGGGKWMIIAIPAAALIVPLAVALLIVSVRPGEPEKRERSLVSSASPSAAESQSSSASPGAAEIATPATRATPPPQPNPTAAPTATAPSGSNTNTAVATPPPPAVALAPTSSSPPGASLLPSTPSGSSAATPPSPSTPSGATSATPAAGIPMDLLTSLDVGASTAHGTWSKDGNVLRCTNANVPNKGHGKLRLVPPPEGDAGYDFAVTFTPSGSKPMFTQILSYKGRQFLFAMYGNYSGFASIDKNNADKNESTRPKGITAGTKHTSLVKVRGDGVSAYLDGALLTSYETTDYSKLNCGSPWNLGPGNSKQSLIGIAVDAPVAIESISFTPLGPMPAGSTPVASAATPPAPPAVSVPPSFKELATLVSSPYSTESSAAATQPAAAPPALDTAKLQSLATAAATSQPAVADAAGALIQPPAANDAAARDALFRAIQLSTTPLSLPADPLLESRPASTATTVDRPEFDSGQSRLAAWRKLAARMADFYPKAKPQNDIVKLNFTDRPFTFFATNSAAEPLTDVSLALETTRALTAPSTTAVHYYFIPRWSPGQKIYFPVAAPPNVSSPELLDSAGPTPLASRIGLMVAKAELWSDQLTQPSQETKFDPNIQPLAHAQLEEAYRLADDVLRRPASPKPAPGAPAPPPPAANRTTALILGAIFPVRPDLEDNSPDFARAKAAAARAAALLESTPSPLADEAKALADKPLTALRELRKRQTDAFIAALAPRTQRQGVFVPHQPGMLQKLARQADREAALSAAGGRLTLTIDTRATDGTSITVTLTNPDQPKDRNKNFAGRLQVDITTNRLLLNLRSTQPAPTKPPAEGDLKHVIYWTALLLEMSGQSGNTLNGIATAGPAETPTVLNVAFGPATPVAPPTPAAPATPARLKPTK